MLGNDQVWMNYVSMMRARRRKIGWSNDVGWLNVNLKSRIQNNKDEYKFDEFEWRKKEDEFWLNRDYIDEGWMRVG